MDNLNKINATPFLDIFTKLGVQVEKDTTVNEFKLQIPGENRISNGSYKVNTLKNVVYANGNTRPQGTPFSYIQMYFNSTDREVFKWFEDNFNIKSEVQKSKPNISKKVILEKLPEYLIGNNFDQQRLGAIQTWLVNRGFTHEYVNSEKGLKRINIVFKTIGFCENPSTKQNKDKIWLPSKPVLIFTALDGAGKIVGAKLRKINNLPEDETTKDSKSINITGSNSGVIYHSLSHIKSCSNLIVVEGEPDYIVMRMLGYDNIIGNLGGVGACREIIRDLTKLTNTIIIAYDNDKAGRDGGRRLAEFCKRQMFYIKYIDRKNVDGDLYKDINEFYEGGFTKEDFDHMINKAFEIKIDDDGRGDYDSIESKIALTMSNDMPFIYLRENHEFYDIYTNRPVRKDAIYDWTGMDNKALKEALACGNIKKYHNVCYWKGGKKYHYNILDEKVILQPSQTPEIHPDIKFLIENLCGYKKNNIQWLHQAILYKYTHINDVLIPAVLFKGVGGSGKGTFMKLMAQIFSEENVMNGLGTGSLTSDFCPYLGNKIIVEINELGGGNHKDAIRILDKLKSLVFEPTIMINPKGVQPRNVGNIAWFIMSSNHQKPLQLDSGSSGNRRFTIINTGKGIEGPRGKEINETIKNKNNVANYLARLHNTYPEVVDWKCILALENEDKLLLTQQSEQSAEKFFTWFEELNPNIVRFSIKERDAWLWKYRCEVGEDHYQFDKKYSIEYFNNNLPHHISKKKISIRGKTVHGYSIEKPIDSDLPTYFLTNEYENYASGI